MRLCLFVSLLLTLAMAVSPLAADTWGAYDPGDREITATTVSGRTVTVEMPFPGHAAGSYVGMSGGRYRYQASGHVYGISLQEMGASLIVTIDSTASHSWGWVNGPEAQTSNTWRRVDVSRYGGAKGFDFNQKANYLDDQDLWLWAFWRPEVSHGTHWKASQPGYTDGNSGSGNVILVPDMLYLENTAGEPQQLYEEIEIRVGDGLWDSVPAFPPERVSPWASELADTVFIDSWSHDSAADLTHLLQTMQRIAGRDTLFFTNWASWGSGGHSAFLPDSLWLDHDPPYPPNHTGYGSLERMKALTAVGDATGWIALRTYYSIIRDESPSYQEGLIRKALDSDGNEGMLSKRVDWPALYQRQEGEIQQHLKSSGSFSDSLSIGFPANFPDFDATVPDGNAMHFAVASDKALAEHFDFIHEGPVTGEGVSNEVLIGPWIATGEYNMHNGRGRRMTPEYKLRRLHGLTTFHGMGLNYRFYDLSTRWTKDYFHRNGWREQGQLDDYRATQLLFGNAGFVYVENNLEDAPWGHYLSEVLMVVPLQRHFALQPVSTVEYETGGAWYTLESLVEDLGFVMETNPGIDSGGEGDPQSPEFERIRVTYANGLQVVANRGAADFVVDAGGVSLTLPQSGWAIWGAPGGQTVLAYSANAPGTTDRVDYLEDHGAGVRFADPRGGTYFDVKRPTQWVWKNGDWQKRLEADLDGAWPAVTLEGQRIPLYPSRHQATDSLDTDFTQGLGGWRTMYGPRTATFPGDGLKLDVEARDPFLHSPRLALPGQTGDKIEVFLRFDQPASGNVTMTLFFQREGFVAFHGDRHVNKTDGIDGIWQTVTIDAGSHAEWGGNTITRLRIDLANNLAPPVDVTIGAIRFVPSQP